jgi:hypothetical protein
MEEQINQNEEQKILPTAPLAQNSAEGPTNNQQIWKYTSIHTM